MIIDFHTHIFPDALAVRAMSALQNNCHGEYKPVHDLTLKGLIAAMDRFGIDKSVVMPVSTKPSQSIKNLIWGESIRSDRIIPFAGIFPDAESWRENIDYAAEHGYKGIKLHPEYQNFEVGDEKMFPLYEYALDKGLIILFHAGYDPIGTAPYRSNPAAFRKVVRAMGGGVIVAAHFGGQSQWDDVEKYLVGENIYLDTSMGTEYYSEEQFLRIVRAHGADKVLFASDSPWSDAGKEIANIEAMPLSAEEKEAVFAGNAKKLLGIAE